MDQHKNQQDQEKSNSEATSEPHTEIRRTLIKEHSFADTSEWVLICMLCLIVGAGIMYLYLEKNIELLVKSLEACQATIQWGS